MTAYFYRVSTGEFTGASFEGPAGLAVHNTPAGQSYVDSDVPIDPTKFRVSAGAIVAHDPQAALFPYVGIEKRQALETAYLRQQRQPVSYAGALWNGGSTALRNVQGALARIQRDSQLPAQWLGWRDYTNTMRWVGDGVAVVQGHLSALLALLEAREQTLLARYWQHKDQLRVLTSSGTVDDVRNYNVEDWEV